MAAKNATTRKTWKIAPIPDCYMNGNHVDDGADEAPSLGACESGREPGEHAPGEREAVTIDAETFHESTSEGDAHTEVASEMPAEDPSGNETADAKTVAAQTASTSKVKSVRIRALDADVDVIKPDALTDAELTVIGVISTTRKAFTEDKHAIASFKDLGRVDVLERVRFSKLEGYLPTTTEGCYIAVRTRPVWLIPLLAVLAALLIALVIWLFASEPWNPTLDPNQGDAATEGTKIYTDTIAMPGFPDKTVDAENPYVVLANPEGNTVYFTFAVTSGGKTLLETQMVEPGKAINWNAFDSFGGQKGVYTATLVINTVDSETGGACNGTVQDIEVTVQ